MPTGDPAVDAEKRRHWELRRARRPLILDRWQFLSSETSEEDMNKYFKRRRVKTSENGLVSGTLTLGMLRSRCHLRREAERRRRPLVLMSNEFSPRTSLYVRWFFNSS